MGHVSKGCATTAALALGILLAGPVGAFSPRETPSAAGPAAVPVSPTAPGAPTAAAPRQPDPALAEALRRLEASDAVWKRNDADFRRQRAAGALSGAEAEAFAAYVAELKVQLLKDCAEVGRLGGGHELGRFACEPPEDRGAAGPVAALPPDPETAMTREEAAESLDDELRRLEGELDELTRRKAEAARQSASLPAGGGVNGRSGAEESGERGGSWTKPGDGAAPPSAERPGEGVDESAGGAADSAPRRDPGTGPGTVEEKKETAKVDSGPVEAGDDDDIVARQLREAAERETDPALKEKLWAEYRKYKAAQR